MKTNVRTRALLLAVTIVVITTASTRLKADTGTCGGASITLPFTDVPSSNIFFCSIAEAFFAGLTNGTDPTHYSPAANVPREQLSAFVTRTLDKSLVRSSRRVALDQLWTTQGSNNLALTDVGNFPFLVKSDGVDLWVANWGDWTVTRVRASDGRVLETWTGAQAARGVLCAMGKVFITGYAAPGILMQIDPTQPAGEVGAISFHIGNAPQGIAYDGQKIWTANQSGSVSIVTLDPTITVTTVSTGFGIPVGIIYDGTNMWVTDSSTGVVDKLRKLDSSGAILMSVDVGDDPEFPAFDGTNIWVPNFLSSTITVVRATGSLTGTVLATLSGNGLNKPRQAAFDGQRMLVTNNNGDSVSLWNATDFTPIGTFSTPAGGSPLGACSDGLNFWVTLQNGAKLARF